MKGDSKFQSRVLVTALRTLAEFGAGQRRVESIAADAVEGCPAALEFEATVVAAVIPEPESDKCDANERAIENDGGGEIEHHKGM